jgi:hypothetical protein
MPKELDKTGQDRRIARIAAVREAEFLGLPTGDGPEVNVRVAGYVVDSAGVIAH